MSKKERNQLYEGMYIISATLSDEARKKALERVMAEISQRKGEVVKVFDQGRRKLAFEINGRKEGYYYVVYFNAPSSILKEVWKEYHLNEDLIRFMTLRAEHVPENLDFKEIVQNAL